MTAPSRHSPSVTPNSHLSFSKRLGIALLRVRWIFSAALQLMDKVLEDASTMLVVLELVEAGAGGRQEHDVSGMSGLCRGFPGMLDGSGTFGGGKDFHLVFGSFGVRA